ncbi:MAG: A/G-specific adenine glycosylase [Deltaproteobacteria bacterium]
MTKFSQKLLSWYHSRKRPMPWRGERDPYKIWLSEVMLQQTQVETVVPYYEKWLKKFPTPQHVAQASEDEVLKMWEGLGYYARGRNFYEACRDVVRTYGGKVPDDSDSFAKLKGVGPYTVAAVQSIAFGRPLPAIDGNVKRVVSRLLTLKKPPSQSLSEIELFLKENISKEEPGNFNQAMMDLGATLCRSERPACSTCPVSSFCEAFKKDEVGTFPIPERRPSRPHYRIAIGIVWRGDKILVTRRPSKGLLGGLWEFPGGKIEKGESAKECVVREIQEEVGLDVKAGNSVGVIRHAYTHFSIEMEGIPCQYVSGRPKALGCDAWRWIFWEEISSLAFPKANHKLFPLLQKTNPFSNSNNFIL